MGAPAGLQNQGNESVWFVRRKAETTAPPVVGPESQRKGSSVVAPLVENAVPAGERAAVGHLGSHHLYPARRGGPMLLNAIIASSFFVTSSWRKNSDILDCDIPYTVNINTLIIIHETLYPEEKHHALGV